MPMKQLLILSGKGGTGKTTVASAFVKLSQAKAFADCDVDAPNLHLVTSCTAEPEKEDYFGLDAKTNQNLFNKLNIKILNREFSLFIFLVHLR